MAKIRIQISEDVIKMSIRVKTSEVNVTTKLPVTHVMFLQHDHTLSQPTKFNNKTC